MSGDEVGYINDSENIEKHTDTFSMTERMLENSIFQKIYQVNFNRSISVRRKNTLQFSMFL